MVYETPNPRPIGYTSSKTVRILKSGTTGRPLAIKITKDGKDVLQLTASEVEDLYRFLKTEYFPQDE